MDRQKEADATASDHHEQTVNSKQTESTSHSDIDSTTKNTSDSTVSSLYNESNDSNSYTSRQHSQAGPNHSAAHDSLSLPYAALPSV